MACQRLESRRLTEGVVALHATLGVIPHDQKRGLQRLKLDVRCLGMDVVPVARRLNGFRVEQVTHNDEPVPRIGGGDVGQRFGCH